MNFKKLILQSDFNKTEKTIHIENSKRMNLSFKDLSYSIQPSFFSSEKKTLLSNVSGNFRAGELTAIMGPSGAGKTVLMDILAGFITTSVRGEIMINGSIRNLKAFRCSSSYIMQYHDLYELLTVQESMHIAAELKLCASNFEKIRRIDVLLKELGLDKVRDTYAGNLSAGQKKRLAIAMELTCDLPIMFFDEPTTGLDSFTTRQCIELLKSLAQAGRTIICTIHQPSASLFNMLDNLYVIAKGHCIYSGSPENVLPFLTSLDFHCPNYHNPADFLLEIANGEYGDHVNKLSKTVSSNYEAFKSPFYEFKEEQIAMDYASSSLTQTRVLLWRNILRTCRDRTYIMQIMIAHFVMAIVCGMTFQNIGQDASRSLDNIKQLAFNVIFLSICSINAALITFPADIPIIKREYFNHWYKLRSVYIANKIMGFIIEVVAVSSYMFITYYLSNQLPEYKRFGLLLLNSTAIALVNQVIGLLISVLFNVKNVVFVGPYSIMPFILFSGIFVRRQDVHPYLGYIYDVSIFKYAFDGFMTSTFGFDREKIKCTTEYCQFSYPKDILNNFLGRNYTNYWPATLVLIGVYFVLHIITYFCLRIKLKKFQFR